MEIELEKIYDYFKSLKSNRTYLQYFNDIEVNNSIINQNPFIKEFAEKQISIMVNKYGVELNKLADFYANGRKTTSSKEKKHAIQIRSDLIYINNQIPIMALMRELPKEVFDSLFKNICFGEQN